MDMRAYPCRRSLSRNSGQVERIEYTRVRPFLVVEDELAQVHLLHRPMLVILLS